MSPYSYPYSYSIALFCMSCHSVAVETIKGGSAVEDMFADPEPIDEDDLDMKLEMFELHQSSGDRPEDLVGATPEFRKEYAEWLAKNER